LTDPSVERRIILKLILEKWYGGAWAGSISLRTRTGGGLTDLWKFFAPLVEKKFHCAVPFNTSTHGKFWRWSKCNGKGTINVLN
jgi:hypothetical protein